jgi:hypothetical protein
VLVYFSPNLFALSHGLVGCYIQDLLSLNLDLDLRVANILRCVCFPIP